MNALIVIKYVSSENVLTYAFSPERRGGSGRDRMVLGVTFIRYTPSQKIGKSLN